VSGETRSIGPSSTLLMMTLVLPLASLLVFATACQDLASGSPVPGSTFAQTTATVAGQATTTLSAAGSATESTGAAAGTATTGGPPDFYMDKKDSGSEVRMHVGDRVRIDLAPYATEKVVSVEWRFTPVVVHERDSGTTVLSGYVTGCWLELEAAALGHVTVRVAYKRSDGTIRIPWVGYVWVK
jgi:hypothetical protein